MSGSDKLELCLEGNIIIYLMELTFYEKVVVMSLRFLHLYTMDYNTFIKNTRNL